MTLRPDVTEDDGSAQARVAGETDAGAVRIPPIPARALRRRAPKLDELLASAVDEARAALDGLAEDGQIGEHAGTLADDDRLVTHRFVAELPGYRGWDWFATLARAPRSKQVTVCEVGLLPGEDALLAPDWVPWSERVSQEEKVRLDAIAAGEDPDKALARFRGEHAGKAAETDDADGPTSADAEGSDGPPSRNSPHAGPQDGADDADTDVDTGSDVADPDAEDDTIVERAAPDDEDGIGAGIPATDAEDGIGWNTDEERASHGWP